RRLYAKEGYSSLFNYLRERFHYSESSAYRRIQAAKMTLIFPEVLGLIEKGKVNLTTLSLIEPHVSKENVGAIVAQVIAKSKRETEAILDSQFLTQRETVRDKIRRLPVFEDKRRVEAIGQEKSPPPVRGGEFLLPLANTTPKSQTAQIYTASGGSNFEESKTELVARRRVKIEFCADEGLAGKIERAKEILRHKFPEGKFEDIFNQALEDMLEKRDPMRKVERLEKRKSENGLRCGSEPEKSEKFLSRYIPQEIKRKVWERDGGQCAYESPNGKRCNEKGFLQLDHVEPFALGGKSTEENLRILCAQHNRWRAQTTFGSQWPMK
ncbi:MAG: HNH endonuclease signature motif containing protein, partial [Deltaproteobacteria bacterium]